MRKDVRRRHDAHTRTLGVCNEHTAVFDATPGGQKTREALASTLTDTDQLLARQQQSKEDQRSAAQLVRTGRETLRNAVKAVVRFGKRVDLGDTGNTPMDTMQVPGGVSDDELLAYARGLIARITPHADAFVAEGLPPDVLANLGLEIPKFVAAKDALAGARQRYAAAAAAIHENQDEADTAADALESIAVNNPAAHPQIVTKLRMARRVGPRPAAAAAKPSPPPTPPTSAPGLSPA